MFVTSAGGDTLGAERRELCLCCYYSRAEGEKVKELPGTAAAGEERVLIRH